MFRCPECDCTTSCQRGIGVHRIKIHAVDDPNIKSVSVVRSYPERKRFLCCICGITIGSFPNFNRHFEKNHPNTSLLVTGFCSICKKDYPNAISASVHCKRSHGFSKKKKSKIPPPDPNSSPIVSSISDKYVVPEQETTIETSLSSPSTRLVSPQSTTQLPKFISSPTSELNVFGKLSSADESHPSPYHDDTLLDKTPEEDSSFIVPPSLKPLPPLDEVMSSTNTSDPDMVLHQSSLVNQTPSCSTQGRENLFNCSQ